MTPHRLLVLITLGFPVLVLLVSYGAIAVHTGNVWPWLEVVHESGNRTLIGTVLYFEHAARELPLDLLLGTAVGGSALWASHRSKPAGHHQQILLSAAVVLVIGVIIAGTLFTGDSASLWNNLLQMHTRPGEPLSYGSHWRYHFLSRLMLMLVSLGIAGLVVLTIRGRNGADDRTGQWVFVGVLGIYIVLSMVFDLNLKPFTDPVFLGHQAREAFTHGLVTLPLAWWFCLVMSSSQEKTGISTISLRWPLTAGIVGIGIAVYLLLGALLGSAASLGQTDNLVRLIFPHFFEHFFSYLLVPLIAALTYKTL